MADKNKATIVIKKIKKGGHGHHGGAWKVAYADFVTAMMAFFLVMWLLGSDEETKSAISNYFNNPASALRPDLGSDKNLPLGDRTGSGDSVMNGLDGLFPEDLIQRPSQPLKQNLDADRVPAETLIKLGLQFDHLRLSLEADKLFKPGSWELHSQGVKTLADMGELLRRHKGTLSLTGFGTQDTYDFAMSRLIMLQRHFVKQKWIDEERVFTTVDRMDLPTKRIVFVLTQ